MEQWQKDYRRDVVNALGRPKWTAAQRDSLLSLLDSVSTAVGNSGNRKIPAAPLVAAETIRALTHVDVFHYVPKAVNKAATDAVIRWLSKDYIGPGNRGPMYEHMPLGSLADFTARAKAWLGDRSELSSGTIEQADYAEALGYAREMTGWRPKEGK